MNTSRRVLLPLGDREYDEAVAAIANGASIWIFIFFTSWKSVKRLAVCVMICLCISFVFGCYGYLSDLAHSVKSSLTSFIHLPVRYHASRNMMDKTNQ